MSLELVILCLLLIVAIIIVSAKNLLHTVVYASIFSLLCALLYLLMNAPDVALTEASIGACITTCLFLAVIKFLNVETCNVKSRFPVILALCILVSIIMLFSAELHIYGDPNAITNSGAVEYYKNHAYEDAGLLSVVNVILSSYRGFDTFGETLVILVAGMCVLLIVDREILSEKKNEK